MAEHSILSASAAHRWLECAGSVAREQEANRPRSSTVYAAEGTAAHKLLERRLQKLPLAADAGDTMTVDGFDIVIDQDMLDNVEHVASTIEGLAGSAMVLPERKLNYGGYLQAGLTAFGTADAFAVVEADVTELHVHDLKYGRGEEVEADDNPQLKLYGLGALAEFSDMLGPFGRVRLFIHQPRLSKAPKEWAISVADLEKWGHGVACSRAITVRNAIETMPHLSQDEWENLFLKAGPEQCRWCPTKATCRVLAASAIGTIENRDITAARIDEFDALNVPKKEHLQVADAAWLAAALSKVDMIEGFCSAVRAEVERRLVAGDQVPGFKLVEGRQGNRAGTNAAEVEELLKKYRLKTKEMYDLKLISPTTAEKLAAKKAWGPRQWTALQEKITRPKGQPHVAPESDKRPAISIAATAAEFDAVPQSTNVDDLC